MSRPEPPPFGQPKEQPDYRHVPYDIEIEQALLGSLLIDNEDIARCGDLKPEHFYDQLHQRMFALIQSILDKGGMVVTPLTLHAEMKADPGLIEVGAHTYLAGLAQAAPAMPNVRDYAAILRDLALRRALIHIGEDVVNNAYEAPHDKPPKVQIEEAAAAIDGLQMIGNPMSSRMSTLQSEIDISLQKAEARLRGEDVVQGVTTGLSKLDAVIGCLQPGDRLLIPARSSMGKTSLADTFARASASQGNPTLVMSVDMNKRQWANRSICAVDYDLNYGVRPIHYSKFRNGTLSNHEIERLVQARRHMSEWPIEIDDQGNQTTGMIRRKVRAMAKRFPGLQGRLVIDFIQLIEPSERRHQSRRDEDLTTVAYELGNIVKDIGWDLVALAQMKNKETDAKGQLKETPPTLSDIRECVTADTRLIDAATGNQISIADVRPGQFVIGLNSEHKTAIAQVKDVWPTGVKPVFRLVTKSGRHIKATANHPFLTDSGWKNLESITEKDLLAVAFRTCTHGIENPENADLCRLLGYMMGNGTMQMGATPGLILPDPEAFADACSIIRERFPDNLIKVRKSKYNDAWFPHRWGRKVRADNPMSEWLEKIGVRGVRDITKFIPDFVFSSGIVGAVEFLNGYLAADGCVSKGEIRFDTTSRRLADDTAALLARIGISCSINQSRMSYNDRPIYRVLVSYEHREAAANILNVRGYRGEKLRALARGLHSVTRGTRFSKLSLPVAAATRAAAVANFHFQGKRLTRSTCLDLWQKTGDDELGKWANSDVMWDDVASIEYAGDEMVYDIAIPGVHSFVGNGIVAHNSGGLEMAADIILTPFRKAWFIERREPDGKYDVNGEGKTEPSVSWKSWRLELSEHQHAMRLIGLKNREDSVSNLNLLLHCDMGANAIMDAVPFPPIDERQAALALDALSEANAEG